MKIIRLLLPFLFLASARAQNANVPATDIAGARDHPALKRYEGSKIFAFSRQDYATYKLALGKTLNPAAPASGGKSVEREETLEGTVTRLSYLAPAGRDALEVFRNYQKELEAKGFETLFKAGDKETGWRFSKRYEGLFSQIFEYNDTNNYYLAARKEGTTAALYVVGYQMGLTGALKPAKGQPLVQLDIVEAKAMDEKMVAVSAEKMAGAIEESGRVALYGIFFDFDKAEVKPESAPALEQIAKLLQSQPSLRLHVVGHTDNKGAFDYNLDLSKRRAIAVVSELAGKYGIARARLNPLGTSCMAPLATNRTEPGRTKNRRVELVEQ